jgi:serine phosphatase RsbU (regulator of sigma subunit)
MPVKPNECATHWISARSFDGAPGSGDFIEVVDLGNGRRGVLVGDIAGRGNSASSAANTLTSYSRTLLFQETLPCDVLRASDEFFGRFLACERTPFASLFVAYIDEPSLTIRYASAGHETALLVEKNGRHRHLEYTGGLLGIKAGLPYGDGFIAGSADESLVIVSDGITDARPPDRDAHFFGSSGVLRAFVAASGADDPARSILHAANVHANGRLVDDSSVLVAYLDGAQSC